MRHRFGIGQIEASWVAQKGANAHTGVKKHLYQQIALYLKAIAYNAKQLVTCNLPAVKRFLYTALYKF